MMYNFWVTVLCIFDTLDQFFNPDHVSHYFRLNDRRTFTKKVCEAKGEQIRGCQLDNNRLQPFPKWPQFFKSDMPTVKISNMLHFSTNSYIKFTKLKPLWNTKLSK